MNGIVTAQHGQGLIFLAESSYGSETLTLSVCIAIHGKND